MRVALLIAVLTFVTYSGSFDGDFVSDDVRGIQQNELLGSLEWDNVKRIFTERRESNYIPITVLSLAVDQAVFGPAPFGYHVTNLVLHIACGLLVYRLLVRFQLPPLAACLAALLWAVHPLNVESVAFMSERKNVLSTLFFLAGFLAYLGFSESGRWSRYLIVLALFVLAVLSKMNTMVLPAVCLAYEITSRFRLRLRDVLASIPMLAIGAGIAWMAVSSSSVWGTSYHGGSAAVTWLTSSTVVFRYLRRVVLPTDLSESYTVPLRGSVLDPVVALSLLGLLALLVVFFRLVVDKRPQAFWFAWFGITLSPMLNIVPFPTLMQDRYMYLPLIGIVALVADVLARWGRSRGHQRALAAATATIVLVFAVMTHHRVEAWSTPISLWEDRALRDYYIASDSARRSIPQQEAKMESLRRSLENDPSNAVLHNNLGALFFELRDLETAKQHLERAARLDPEDPIVLLNLGRTYRWIGDLEKAERALEEAVEADPYSFFAHLNLARVHLAGGQASAARAALDAAERIRPANTALTRPERLQLEHLQAGAP